MECQPNAYDEKKVSIIMSVYKESKDELRSAIDSILNQTYKNIEFIIVLDNPEEDWRQEFIKSYKDERISLLVNEKNIGLPQSLNRALGKANGFYIARMDADDISLPNRIEKQIEFLNQNDYDMCGAYVTCFIDNECFEIIRFPVLDNNVKKLAYIKNCVSHPTFFLKKEVYDNLNGYHNIFSCEDYDFLLRAINHGYKIGNVPEVLLKYRINPKSISRLNAGKQELIAMFLKKFYKNNKKNEVTDFQINNYILSKSFKNKLKSYDFYWKMKNTRSKYKSSKFPMFYIYTILLIINVRHSLKEIYRKICEIKYNN